jgi:hypothetical protein
MGHNSMFRFGEAMKHFPTLSNEFWDVGRPVVKDARFIRAMHTDTHSFIHFLVSHISRETSLITSAITHISMIIIPHIHLVAYANNCPTFSKIPS